MFCEKVMKWLLYTAKWNAFDSNVVMGWLYNWGKNYLGRHEVAGRQLKQCSETQSFWRGVCVWAYFSRDASELSVKWRRCLYCDVKTDFLIVVYINFWLQRFNFYNMWPNGKFIFCEMWTEILSSFTWTSDFKVLHGTFISTLPSPCRRVPSYYIPVPTKWTLPRWNQPWLAQWRRFLRPHHYGERAEFFFSIFLRSTISSSEGNIPCSKTRRICIRILRCIGLHLGLHITTQSVVFWDTGEVP
jgi:hypothetical protein